ncbi:hypothetical protein TTHERM_00151580 (macronuclear) [Tetrahymena thermophila SB210]|uniref:Uncharacterized protein n=1 Tax=Tetrahymena thermophila (strain SB210) TaxID=312017 RepID=I7M9E7_TETTS|nr:hypothetical protein TTHERM_00151580 [Tetrahymena thermophila SB210]7W5Z_Y Chain Y, Cytochrome c oxidase subunit TT25 [Tetrahymena thermophila]7W5Z_y Chain y, Cytochrome c oxidase subunit TT25 [Tetrahymena thermophila]8B6H_ER Chain ER, Lysozyme [Tetrahymena thermophila SB210]8B6H_Er Chain Er, Lysozyme [Tetrahymena thermophila SB210]8BQS_ER Chain ER, Lysozyme [Tetrahymena thermophila SB210]8BQS_Er Chain Er, Lysozyme [Tetrahymena thermophila SB210]8GYM_Y Chain Y, Lysozyme [Tetrahymena therm|eukprot:XP_001021691.3 hypothetical protein TTHERM_00151580 [Tetrahymena thermophila SB210]
MAQTAHQNRYQGGLCYAQCNELFSFWNPSIQQCWKGCDFGVGRVNDPEGRIEAQQMCKRWAAELYWTYKGELDTIKDLRVHADMYPTTPQNVYRACLAGVRRQKF